MIITSSNNEKIKTVKKMINDKNYLFLDNPKLIEEAINADWKINTIIIEENKADKFKKIIESLDKCEIIEVSSSVFSGFSNTVVSQGIVAVILKKEREFAFPKSNYLILDEVQDPGNVGTLIRSALGAGFEDVYLLNCANLSNEKVVRSTMGAIFKTRIYELTRADFIQKYKDFKIKNLLITDMKGKDIFKTPIKIPCGIVIGNEGNGISKEIRELSNEIISIPMLNNLESLNASVAGSIVMFKIGNQ